MIDFSLYKKTGTATINDEIDLLLQQVDMIFNTTPTEVLGDNEFGTEYDRYLYDLKMSAENIKHVVEGDLSNINTMGWTYNVDTYLLHGTEQDILVIDIAFIKGSEVVKKTYKIS